jgi:small conductance mechanosensitive channel
MTGVAVAGLLVGALLLPRVSGFVLRLLMRHVAERTPTDFTSRWWRVATPRTVLDLTSEVGEARRRQRVDSAARMLNHLLAIFVWIVVTIATFHILDIDAAFFLSSAGFLGAGLAIGGQHKVNDYLTGLSVLFEDRYGAGDELVVNISADAPVNAVVDHVGLFTTRLRDERSTLHVPNGQLVVVRNLSQEARAETIRVHVADNPEYDLVSERSAADVVRQMAGSEHLTDVFFVGDLAAARREDGDIDVEVKTVRPLDDRSREVLVQRTQRALRGKR